MLLRLAKGVSFWEEIKRWVKNVFREKPTPNPSKEGGKILSVRVELCSYREQGVKAIFICLYFDKLSMTNSILALIFFLYSTALSNNNLLYVGSSTTYQTLYFFPTYSLSSLPDFCPNSVTIMYEPL